MKLPDLSQRLWDIQAEVAPSFTEWQQLEHPSAYSNSTGGDNKKRVTEKKKFKWATSLDSIFKLNFQEAMAIQSLELLTKIGDSVTIEGQEKSSAGSVGVFFVQTNVGVFVLKAASHSLCAELYAAVSSLAFGVYSPRLLLLKTSDPFTDHLLDSLAAKDPSRNTFGLHEQRYVLAMEYVPGCHFSLLGSMPFTNHVTLMRTLGKIVCMDVFLNNGDRIPFIWDNQGNAGNLHLIVRNDEEGNALVDLVNIDPGVRAIDSDKFPEEAQEYFSKCEETLSCIVEYHKSKGPVPKVISHLLGVISMWARHEMTSDENAQTFTEGFVDILSLFKTSQVDQKVSQPLQRIVSYLQYVCDCTEVGESETISSADSIGLPAISQTFVTQMIKIFSAAADKMQ